MTNFVIISICFAVAAFFVWHCVDRITDERRQRRIAEEIEKVKGELRNALENGNVARACQLRKRLQELVTS